MAFIHGRKNNYLPVKTIVDFNLVQQEWFWNNYSHWNINNIGDFYGQTISTTYDLSKPIRLDKWETTDSWSFEMTYYSASFSSIWQPLLGSIEGNDSNVIEVNKNALRVRNGILNTELSHGTISLNVMNNYVLVHNYGDGLYYYRNGELIAYDDNDYRLSNGDGDYSYLGWEYVSATASTNSGVFKTFKWWNQVLPSNYISDNWRISLSYSQNINYSSLLLNIDKNDILVDIDPYLKGGASWKKEESYSGVGDYRVYNENWPYSLYITNSVFSISPVSFDDTQDWKVNFWARSASWEFPTESGPGIELSEPLGDYIQMTDLTGITITDIWGQDSDTGAKLTTSDMTVDEVNERLYPATDKTIILGRVDLSDGTQLVYNSGLSNGITTFSPNMRDISGQGNDGDIMITAGVGLSSDKIQNHYNHSVLYGSSQNRAMNIAPTDNVFSFSNYPTTNHSRWRFQDSDSVLHFSSFPTDDRASGGSGTNPLTGQYQNAIIGTVSAPDQQGWIVDGGVDKFVIYQDGSLIGDDSFFQTDLTVDAATIRISGEVKSGRIDGLYCEDYSYQIVFRDYMDTTYGTDITGGDIVDFQSWVWIIDGDDFSGRGLGYTFSSNYPSDVLGWTTSVTYEVVRNVLTQTVGLENITEFINDVQDVVVAGNGSNINWYYTLQRKGDISLNITGVFDEEITTDILLVNGSRSGFANLPYYQTYNRTFDSFARPLFQRPTSNAIDNGITWVELTRFSIDEQELIPGNTSYNDVRFNDPVQYLPENIYPLAIRTNDYSFLFAWRLQINDYGAFVRLNDSDLFLTGTWSNNVWYNWEIEKENSQYSVYVDSVLVGTASIVSATISTNNKLLTMNRGNYWLRDLKLYQGETLLNRWSFEEGGSNNPTTNLFDGSYSVNKTNLLLNSQDYVVSSKFRLQNKVKAKQYNGSTQYSQTKITAGTDVDPRFTNIDGDMSCSFFVTNLRDQITNGYIISTGGYTGTIPGFAFAISSSNSLSLFFRDDSTYQTVSSSFHPITQDLEYHVVLTYNHTTHNLKVYVDNVVELNTTLSTGAANQSPIDIFRIGSPNNTTIQYLANINIRDIRLFKEELDATQVANEFNENFIENTPYYWYKLNEDTDDGIMIDTMGNLNGTHNNSPTSLLLPSNKKHYLISTQTNENQVYGWSIYYDGGYLKWLDGSGIKNMIAINSDEWYVLSIRGINNVITGYLNTGYNNNVFSLTYSTIFNNTGVETTIGGLYKSNGIIHNNWFGDISDIRIHQATQDNWDNVINNWRYSNSPLLEYSSVATGYLYDVENNQSFDYEDVRWDWDRVVSNPTGWNDTWGYTLTYSSAIPGTTDQVTTANGLTIEELGLVHSKEHRFINATFSVSNWAEIYVTGSTPFAKTSNSAWSQLYWFNFKEYNNSRTLNSVMWSNNWEIVQDQNNITVNFEKNASFQSGVIEVPSDTNYYYQFGTASVILDTPTKVFKVGGTGYTGASGQYLSTDNGATLTFWVKVDSTPTYKYYTVCGNTNSYNKFILVKDNGFITWDNDSGSLTSNAKQIDDGEWHFVVADILFSTRFCNLYVDDINAGEAKLTFFHPSGSNQGSEECLSVESIGSYLGDFTIDGGIKDVRLHNKRLNQNERINVKSGAYNESEVAWYRLDEGFGSTVIDSANSLNTELEDVTALYFNGTSKVEAPTNTYQDKTTENFTLLAWIKTIDKSSDVGVDEDQGIISKISVGPNVNGYALYLGSGSVRAEFVSSTNRFTTPTINTSNLDLDNYNDWVLIAARYDRSANVSASVIEPDGTIYTDVIDISSEDGNSITNTETFTIGNYFSFAERDFFGFIKQAAVYDSLLTDNELIELSKQGKSHSFAQDVGDYTSSASLSSHIIAPSTPDALWSDTESGTNLTPTNLVLNTFWSITNELHQSSNDINLPNLTDIHGYSNTNYIFNNGGTTFSVAIAESTTSLGSGNFDLTIISNTDNGNHGIAFILYNSSATFAYNDFDGYGFFQWAGTISTIDNGVISTTQANSNNQIEYRLARSGSTLTYYVDNVSIDTATMTNDYNVYIVFYGDSNNNDWVDVSNLSLSFTFNNYAGHMILPQQYPGLTDAFIGEPLQWYEQVVEKEVDSISTSWTPNVWEQYVITYLPNNRRGLQLWKNGQLVAYNSSINVGDWNVSEPIFAYNNSLTGQTLSPSSFWLGQFQWWKRPLEKWEIELLYDYKTIQLLNYYGLTFVTNRFLSSISIETDGLVLWYEFGNTSSYPGSGNIIYDLSSNNNNGILGSNYSWNSSGYLQFSNTTTASNILVGTDLNGINTNINTLTDWTIEAKYYSTDINTESVLYGNEISSDGTQLKLYYGTISYGDTVNEWTNQASYNINNQWNHLSITKQNNTYIIYHDGSISNIINFVDVNDNDTTNPYYIGGSNYINNLFDGYISMFRIYNKVLTSNQIYNNYQLTATPTIVIDGPAGFVPLILSINTAQDPDVQTTLNTGTLYYINWNEGSNVEATSTVQETFSYGDPYSGNVYLWFDEYSHVSDITLYGESINSQWDFDISVLSQLTQLQTFNMVSGNELTGNISTLPSTLNYFGVGGSNTISGNISSFGSNINTIIVLGSNTITGDISDTPISVEDIEIGGNNTLSGNIDSLHEGILTVDFSGNNTISGTIDSLPSTITELFVTGNNTVSGDVTSLGGSIGSVFITGNNTISGDVGSLINNNLFRLRIAGNNTISGDVTAMSTSIMNYIELGGSNTVTGEINGFNSYSNLSTVDIEGNNTIWGDVGDIPRDIDNFVIINGATLSYTGTTLSVPNDFISLRLNPLFGGLSQFEVDNLLEDLQVATLGNSGNLIELRGDNAAPGPRGITASTLLISDGWGQVLLN